jgi:hypothetical protein
MKRIIILLTLITLGCATGKTVRSKDLYAWIDVPVEALDTHSFFITLPMIRTITKDEVEIRNYVNKRNIGSCFNLGYSNTGTTLSNVAFNSFATCLSSFVGCNNVFYIKNDHVIEYVPVGQCYTDDFVQPESRYKRLMQ